MSTTSSSSGSLRTLGWWPSRSGSARDSLLAEGVLVARHEIEYLAPLEFRRPGPGRHRRHRCRRGRVHPGYVLRDPDEVGDHRYAVAATRLVAYDFAAAAPKRLPASIRADLQRREDADADAHPVFRWR